MGLNDDVVIIEPKTWDEWVKANPNLVNIEPAIFVSTVGKKWNEYQIGWVELGADNGL